MTETLEEHAPLYVTVKNWMAQFKRGDFYTCDAPRPERPKTVTTPQIIVHIHELILEDHRISAKSTAEQLGISCERVGSQLGISCEQVGSIIHGALDMWKLSVKWVPKCLKADQKHKRCQLSEELLVSELLLEFFWCNPNDFLSRLVTMDETLLHHYGPETK